MFQEEFPPFIIEQQLHINAVERLSIVVALNTLSPNFILLHLFLLNCRNVLRSFAKAVKNSE